MKTLFAYVDKTENFTFTFQPGISDSDIYPGMTHCISWEWQFCYCNYYMATVNGPCSYIKLFWSLSSFQG